MSQEEPEQPDESEAGSDPLLYARPETAGPVEPSRLEAALETTGKVAVGCLSCVTLIAAAVGTLLGLGGGALYHALWGQEGNLWLQLGGGALVGFLAGARTVVPIEELLFDWFEEKVLGGREGPRGKRGRSDSSS